MKPDIFALLGIASDDAFALMAAVAASITVWAVWNTLVERDPMVARVQRLRRRREELRAGIEAPKRNQHQKVRAMGFMQTVVRRFNLLKNKTTGDLVELLARAGWRSRDALVVFAFMKLCLPLACGAGALALFGGLQVVKMQPAVQTLVVVAAVFIGYYAPKIFVANAIKKREKALQKGLPDALDLLVICAEAGLSLDAALTRVAREMGKATPEVAEEFGLTAVELGFLPERRKALDNLTKRCQTASIRGVVNTLIQTERYGTPLAHSLRVLAGEFRDERMLKAEEKAAKLPAVLTVPLIIFILPTLMIVLLGPGILRIIDAFSRTF
jgi:tight adherence protein C